MMREILNELIFFIKVIFISVSTFMALKIVFDLAERVFELAERVLGL